MVLRQVAQPVRRLVRLRRPSSHAPISSRRAEIARVNRQAGQIPVAPEFSGLRLRHPGIPKRATHIAISLAYRWHPSPEYRQRRREERILNRALKERTGSPAPPPVLTYGEGSQIAPTRLQPMPFAGRNAAEHIPLPLDLLGQDEAQWAPGAITVAPTLPGPDQEYLIAYRPLLPRQYSRFLRTSPYPRVAVLLLAAFCTLFSGVWFSREHSADAAAAGKMHAARTALQQDFAQALAYGVSSARLSPLRHAFSTLDAHTAPMSLLGGSTRHFYLQQEMAYLSLRATLHALEKRALAAWITREERTYSALAQATAAAHTLSLPAHLPPAPSCASPACYRVTVARQRNALAALHAEMAGIRRARSALLAGGDPIAAAQTRLQEARTLTEMVNPAHLPITLPALDALEAGGQDSLTVGSLAWLDTDAMRAALIRTLPARAIVISIEDGSLTAYQRGQLVLRSAALAEPSAPTGTFHIIARQASLPSTYWSQTAAGYQYRDGTLPFWMSFSGDAAIQGAPWRVFPSGLVEGFAPFTPRSIDLPPAAARRLFTWAVPGTDVVVY